MNNKDREVDRELYAIERSLRSFADSLAEARGADEKELEGEEATARFRRQAQHKWKKMRHTADKSRRRVDEAAHDNPWQAVGIAAAVGALVGALLTSKRRGGDR